MEILLALWMLFVIGKGDLGYGVPPVDAGEVSAMDGGTGSPPPPPDPPNP